MNCEVPGAIIRYTTDGTTPTEQSSKFYKFANISQACTVKAVAMKDGWITSVESAIVLPPTIEKHPELIDEVNQCLDYISSLELLQQAVELSHDSLYNAMLAAGTAKYPPYEKDLSYTASRIVSLKTNVSSLLTSCMYPETFRLNLTDYTYSVNYVKEELNRIWTAIRSQSNGIAGLKSSTNVTIRQYDLQGRIATGRRPAIVVEKVNTPGNLSVRKRVVK
jgi:hypothetical protein